jgi:hypothetical protein
MQELRATFSYEKFAAAALAVIALTGGVGARAQAPASQAGAKPGATSLHHDSSAVVQERAFLKQYCETCHNAKLRTAGLALDTVDLDDIPRSGEILEKVVRKVWTGSMPPAKALRPDSTTISAFLTSLEASLDHNAAVHPFAGRPTMLHRLNRTEYINAVHDLLNIELTPDDAALLPADDLSYGFDNNGDVLGLPPLLLERYLSVAKRASIMALGSVGRDADVAVFTHTIDYGPSQARRSEGMPLGTRGGAAFTYHFPADGEYSIKIKLHRSNGRIEGLLTAQTQQEETPRPRDRLIVGLDGKTVGLFLIGFDQTIQEKVPDLGEGVANLPEPPVKELSRVDYLNRAFTGDDNLQFRLTARAGDHHVTAAFLARYVAVPSQMREPYAAGQGGDARPVGVYSVTITGPFNPKGPGDTLSRRRVFSCHPHTPAGELPCVRKTIGDLAHRAYRRPVTDREMKELLSAYERGRKGDDFEGGFELAIRRILMDPSFLLRIEHEPEGIALDAPFRISDLELASRLSFFLWSTIPDGELLAVAEKGQLKNPAALEHQVRRMLADPRARSLVSNFASEWLGLRVVAGVQPDPLIFSDFNGLKQAFQRETGLFLNYVMLGDRNLLELLNANYTFVNERLAVHYGIPNIYGNEFRLVTVNDGIRGGLLGQGGILTATSYPNRTSPVLRGKWILDNLIGSPPPPPPPNVPRLDDEENANVLSMRERMAAHRRNPACAGCHARMDPLGLALENFDATGKWRAGERLSLTDLTLQPIDARGELADGTTFDGISGLKKVLQERSDQFIYTMTEQLLTYALGRGVEWYDAPAIRAAVRASKKDDYHFSTLVLSIVKSTPFQLRMPLSSKDLQAEEQKQR